VTETLIVRPARHVSASKLIDVMAESLSVIKEQDQLTDADLGAVMHKGADQGAKYRTGLAEMGAVAFLRGCSTWNGRFANDALALIGMKLTPLYTHAVSEQSLQTRLAKLMLELSVALEDGKVDELELQRMKRTLVEAGEAIDSMRGRAA
jgi:hypothetical protein